MDEAKEPGGKANDAEGDGKKNLIIEKGKEAPPPEYDEKSVYVKNLHPKTSKTELEENFSSCGNIARTTIAKDPMTGYAYGY